MKYLTEEYLKQVEENIKLEEQQNRLMNVSPEEYLITIKKLHSAYIEIQEEYNELEQLLQIRNKRSLIKRFNSEFDREDKLKNPNREYYYTQPDVEEVYKRYYELLEENKKLKGKPIQKVLLTDTEKQFLQSYIDFSGYNITHIRKNNKLQFLIFLNNHMDKDWEVSNYCFKEGFNNLKDNYEYNLKELSLDEMSNL